MEAIFDIENFNVISDEENYYFFRALNSADSRDIATGVVIDSSGQYIRLRTDRERYEEDPEKGKSKYNEDDEISLEQVHDHIKMHYRKDTNCVSLSSNANVLLDYGRRNYDDRYIMITVPKREIGQRVRFAGQYMLDEIQKRIDEMVSTLDAGDEKDAQILEEIEQIDNAISSDEIRDLISAVFKSSEPVTKKKTIVKEGIKIRTPHSRISRYQALDDEQNLEKNKIIGKLTLLERKLGIGNLIPHVSNNKVSESVGNAFSSMEQVHYGDIPGKQITNVPSRIMDMFALLQQIEDKNIPNVEDIKRELIEFLNSGMNFEIPEDSFLLKNTSVRDDITIEEMYELTGGRVEYGQANSIVKNMFYLSKSQVNAREIARILDQITGNNPRYKEVIEYISNNGFTIEPEIITRQSNNGYRISESVNLNLRAGEMPLVESIKELSTEEQIEILERGGLSDTRGIITSTFSRIQKEEKISREEYYAGAIIDSYNWERIRINEFTLEQRRDFLRKLQEKDCVKIYQRLKQAGIPEIDIPVYAINIASQERYSNILNEDNFIELIQQNRDSLSQELSIPQIETFLGYYDIEGTDIVLRDYQRNAVEKTDKIFETKRFASVVLPTGAGKSFVALTELYEHKDEPILYLAPQAEILEQIKDYIIEYIHGKKGTLGKSKDEIIRDVFPNIKFETYSGLLAQRGKDIIEKEYGFIVLDELHRTGAKEWEKKIAKLLENQGEETRVLGITATPTRDMDDRNMANEMALRLGYTKEEVESNQHIAMNMDLIEAIKLGLVVNPKVVSCEYSLTTDGSIENLLEKINSIEDEDERKEKLAQFEKLRRRLDNAAGIPEILQTNIKPGGKYIVFIPIIDGEEIEDEDGNIVGKKTGKDKIKEYEQKMTEYLNGCGLTPRCYSMLGAYSDKENLGQLESFENDDSENVKFMIVMNKANEGLHIAGVDGIIWFRALDENSRILYLQQLGRAIYSEDPNNPTPDEERPVIIDLANNTLRVDIDKELKTNTGRDDLELLSFIVDWVILHGEIPNIESTNKIERRYAATLYRIQNKYIQYLDGFDKFPDLDEKQIQEINTILIKGAEIDLWDIELSPKLLQQANTMLEVTDFEVNGILKDFVELENEVYEINSKNAVEKFIKKLEKLQQIGVDVSKISNRDTIETLAKKSGIDKEEIERIELDPKDKIGKKKSNISQNYRGNSKGVPPTEEQVQRLLELGISLERIERNRVDEFIEKLEKLKEIGIDVSLIKNADTIESLAKKSGVGKEEIIQIGLNPKDKIGFQKTNISQAYRGRGENNPPTEEQVQRLLELGIRLERIERNIVDELIVNLDKLRQIGVDVSKIQDKDTIETLAKKSGIDKEKIESIGVNPNYRIGLKKSCISQIYRGNSEGVPPTEEQVKRLLQFSISLEKKEKNSVDEFIWKVEKLQKIGVDTSLMIEKDTIETLAKKSGISKEEIESAGLEPKDRIGSKKSGISKAYRGKGTNIPPTEEQVQRLLELGISLEKKKRNIVDEFIGKIEKLQKIGVDTSRMVDKDTIETLAKKSGISKEEIKRAGLNPNDKISTTKNCISLAHRGKGTNIPPTEEQVQRLLELGVSLEKKRRSGKEMMKASISALGDIEMIDSEGSVLEKLAEKVKEGGIKTNAES